MSIQLPSPTAQWREILCNQRYSVAVRLTALQSINPSLYLLAKLLRTKNLPGPLKVEVLKLYEQKLALRNVRRRERRATRGDN